MATEKQILCREYNWLLLRVRGSYIHPPHNRNLPKAVAVEIEALNKQIDNLLSILTLKSARTVFYHINGELK